MEGDSETRPQEHKDQPPPDEPTATAVQQRLQELGTEYDHLREKEQEMLELLERLQREEKALVAGISQLDPVLVQKTTTTTTTTKAPIITKKKRGLQRLEEALMQGLDDSSSNNNSSDEG